MFLSTYENNLDKKGRVSVPANFRSHLSNLGYNGVICYPSFNNLDGSDILPSLSNCKLILSAKIDVAK